MPSWVGQPVVWDGMLPINWLGKARIFGFWDAMQRDWMIRRIGFWRRERPKFMLTRWIWRDWMLPKCSSSNVPTHFEIDRTW
jgi:hypothetical protein